MFKGAQMELNPVSLIRVDGPGNQFKFKTNKLSGVFYRISSVTGREVRFLQHLVKGDTVHTPISGSGILVNATMIDNVLNNVWPEE